jgi:hypothetical protein
MADRGQALPFASATGQQTFGFAGPFFMAPKQQADTMRPTALDGG